MVDKDEYNALQNFINNNINKNKSYFWIKGYKIFGPLLYAYVKWLEENFLRKDFDNIYFLSRDGFIMQKAFEIVNPKIKTKYLYASRRALIVPTLWLYDDLEDVVNIMFFGSNTPVSVFIKRLGLCAKNYERTVQKYGYKLDQVINVDKEKSIKNFQDLYRELKSDIDKNSKEEYENLVKYLYENKFEKRVAIVDIGWFGNMQNALQKIIDIAKIPVEIEGFYVGIIPSSDKQKYLKMKGFLFEKNKNEKMYLEKYFFNSIFEIVFMASHGSLKRYGKEKLEFYDFEYEESESFEKIKDFQDGALSFVKDYSEKKNISFSEYTSMENFFRFGNTPTNEDIGNFRDICFYDDDCYNLIPKDLSPKYLLNPKKFIKEFEKSPWKTAFLKKVFKVNINYYKILVFIRKIIKR